MATQMMKIGIGCGMVAILAAGCSSTAKPIVPVEGKITFTDGQPLPKGTRVVLNPSEGNVGTASGVTDESGAFKLTHANGSTGAEIGKYSVQILAPENGDAAAFYKQVPKDITDGNTFLAEVKEGMSPLDFKVPRPKK